MDGLYFLLHPKQAFQVQQGFLLGSYSVIKFCSENSREQSKT